MVPYQEQSTVSITNVWSLRVTVFEPFTLRSMLFSRGLNEGVPRGFTAYVTHFPCLNCTKQLLQVGCKRVVYINQYRMDDYAKYLYQEKGTELTHLPLETVQTALQEADLL